MTESPDIKFIYFDLDDTLLDHGHAERSALSETLSLYPSDFSEVDTEHVLKEYHDINVILWRDYGLGKISRQELQDQRFRKLLDAFRIESVNASDMGNHYLTCYPKYWRYCPGAEEVFHAVAEQYQVGVITNGFEQTQRKKLDAFPDLRDQLSSIVISETVGFLKPDLRLFHHAVSEAGVRPEEILYVGDSYESDVVGATNAGWRVAWYVPDSSRARDTDAYVFSEWKEFDPLRA